MWYFVLEPRKCGNCFGGMNAAAPFCLGSVRVMVESHGLSTDSLAIHIIYTYIYTHIYILYSIAKRLCAVQTPLSVQLCAAQRLCAAPVRVVRVVWVES